jgi:hypothetical protein
MRVQLLYPDRDVDLQAAPPPQTDVVAPDLALDSLVQAMAGGDTYLAGVAQQMLWQACGAGDMATVQHRQAVLRDALAHAAELRALYDLVVQAIDSKKQHLFSLGVFGHYPSSVLHGSVELLRTYTGWLRKLREATQALAVQCSSEGLQGVASTLQDNLDDTYLATVQQHLDTLRFRHGARISAGLGPGCAGRDYVLRLPNTDTRGWLTRLIGKEPPHYVFRLADRDEAGARALSALYDCGIAGVANVMAQSTEHVQQFLEALRAELAFYIGALNLHDALAALGVDICLPTVNPQGATKLKARDLRDPALALTSQRAPVPNDCLADDRDRIVITGANTGGKSTYLRALGLAQVMLHAGLFVCASSYAGSLRSGVFTHYKREEDATLKSGKFDEELQRMSTIAEHLRPGAVVLFNESFASTNEREGSEIFLQVLSALRQRGISAWLVTHLVSCAQALYAQDTEHTLFMRADRQEDGSRSFVLQPAPPLRSAWGEDLYREIFASASPQPAAVGAPGA